MHFYIYLKNQLEMNKISQARLCLELSISPATASLWLSNKRKPDYEKLQKVVSFFARSQSQQKKHLHEIFFG